MLRVQEWIRSIWIVALAASASMAAPLPDSLRLEKTDSSVRLTWLAGEGPYAIFRSHDPTDLERPAWMIGVTDDLFYDDQLDGKPGTMAYYFVGDPIPCASDAECDDNLPCNGIETCDLRIRACEPGIAILCNDGDACTVDECDESTASCVYAPRDCSDGDACTLDSCDSLLGCTYDVDPNAGIGQAADLAGRELTSFPFFEFSGAVNASTTFHLGVDPHRHQELVGQSCDAYLVEARRAAEWCQDQSLSDVRGQPQSVSIVSGGIEDNTFLLLDSDTLSADAGQSIGRGYDLVLDCNQNGLLDGGEIADGLSDRAGIYLTHDITASGPLAVSTFDDLGPEPPHCSGGGNDDMRVYYPADLDDPLFEGTFPLVVVSHGNGHCYDWYDFLGNHLASYGYIVMSHDNDTQPGIETASTTTLEFTDKILRDQATLGGGVLEGHIDGNRIAWIGHSRGGEGVARAYDRLVDESYQPTNYTASDIVVISSIAPTDFLGPDKSDPHGVSYHLLYGSADGDVCGCPNNAVTQSFSVYERAVGARQATYVHGADHNDFNCCGVNDFTGPPETEIGRPEAQQVQKAVSLALLEHYIEGSLAAKDFLWRQYESFKPIGVDPATIVVNEARESPAKRGFVVDDYQNEPSLSISSSGGQVSATVSNVVEDRQRDTDSSYEWTGSEAMNGMARGRVGDLGRGVVFDYGASADGIYEFEIIPSARDLSSYDYLSLRAAQGTRHPETVAQLEDLTFVVTLIDTGGIESSINIGVYGGGVEEPYQRSGFGAGEGWQNEFETIKIRLSDFQRNGTNLDLSSIERLRLDFGASFGSDRGRIALDDIEFVAE